MRDFSARIERVLARPPGSDEGFSPEAIALHSRTDFSKLSAWSIICEDVLDTQYPRVYFELAWQELRRRGITDGEIAEMRRFAWLTAGWLNFKMMAWEWVSLDEKDIHGAIELQYKDGWISAKEKTRRIEYMRRYQHV